MQPAERRQQSLICFVNSWRSAEWLAESILKYFHQLMPPIKGTNSTGQDSVAGLRLPLLSRLSQSRWVSLGRRLWQQKVFSHEQPHCISAHQKLLLDPLHYLPCSLHRPSGYAAPGPPIPSQARAEISPNENWCFTAAVRTLAGKASGLRELLNWTPSL